MVKAFVFDLDGTIVDTEKAIFQAYKEALKLYDFELTEDVWAKYVGGVGTPTFICEHVENVTGKEVDIEKTIAYGETVLRELIKKERPLPGVIELLEEAKREGIKIALATNSNKKWATTHLTNLHLLDYFDELLTVDQVLRPKPHPEIYVKAVHSLGVAPIEAIAFEDSVIGSKAAVAAGLHTVAIPSTLMKEENFAHTHLQLPSLANTDVKQLTNLFQSAKYKRKIS